ncbi:MAG: FecR domain-containing protein [Rhodospirillaceae bacterium]|nr:FecR domain-containing protein [Rhodospirillales bacterium]
MAKGGEGKISGHEQAAFAAVLQAGDAGRIVIPGGDFLLNAEFERSGPDLVLVGADGTRILVQGFFADSTPPDLVTSAGAHIDAALAAKMAGPMAPGQYAQNSGGTALTTIGKVGVLNGKVMVKHADGTKTELHKGDPVFKDDVLDTDKAGSVGITFEDGTTFSLGGSGRMVLDELVYDATAHTGSGNIAVLKGAFTFVSGQIPKSHPDAMTIKTPVMTVGIRGTAGAGNTETIVLLAEKGGVAGELTITTSSGQTLTINTPGLSASVGQGGTLSTAQMSQSQIQQLGGSAFSAMTNPGSLANPPGNQNTPDPQDQKPAPTSDKSDKAADAASPDQLHQELVAGIRELQGKVQQTVQWAIQNVTTNIRIQQNNKNEEDARIAKEVAELANSAKVKAEAATSYATAARLAAIQGEIANANTAYDNAKLAAEGQDPNATDTLDGNRGAEDYAALAAEKATGHGSAAQSFANQAAEYAAAALKAEGLALGYKSSAANLATSITAWKDGTGTGAIALEVAAAGEEVAARAEATRLQGEAVTAAKAATDARNAVYDLTVDAAATAVVKQILELARDDAVIAYLKAAKELTIDADDLAAINNALDATLTAADVTSALAGDPGTLTDALTAAGHTLTADVTANGANSLLQVWKDAEASAISDYNAAVIAAGTASGNLNAAQATSELRAGEALAAAEAANQANITYADKSQAAGEALGFEGGAEAAWQFSLDGAIDISLTTLQAKLVTATSEAAAAKHDAELAEAATNVADALAAKNDADNRLGAAQSAQSDAATALTNARNALAHYTDQLPANFAQASAEVKALVDVARNAAQLAVDRLTALKADIDQQVEVAQQQDNAAIDAWHHAQSVQAVADVANVALVSTAQAAADAAYTTASTAESSAAKALSSALAAKESASSILSDLTAAGAPAAQIALAQKAVDKLIIDVQTATNAVGNAHSAFLLVAEAKTAVHAVDPSQVLEAKALALTAVEQAKAATAAASDASRAATDSAAQLATASAAKTEASRLLSEAAASSARAADVAAAQAAVDQITVLKAAAETAKAAAVAADTRLTNALGAAGDATTATTLYGEKNAAAAAKTAADAQSVDAQAKLSADKAYAQIEYVDGTTKGALVQAAGAQAAAHIAAEAAATKYAAILTALTAAQTALTNAKAAQADGLTTSTFAGDAQKQLQTATAAAAQVSTQKATVDSAASTFDTQAAVIDAQSQVAIKAAAQAAAAVQARNFAETAIAKAALVKTEAAEALAHLQDARTHSDQLTALAEAQQSVTAKLLTVQTDKANVQSDVDAIKAGASSYFKQVDDAYQAALNAAGSYTGAAANELARAKAAWDAASAAKLDAENALTAVTSIATQAEVISNTSAANLNAQLIAGYKTSYDAAIAVLTNNKTAADAADDAAAILKAAANTHADRVLALLGAGTEYTAAQTLAANITTAADAAHTARTTVDGKATTAAGYWTTIATPGAAKTAADNAQALAAATGSGSASYSTKLAQAQANTVDQLTKQWQTVDNLVYQKELSNAALTAGADAQTINQGGAADIAVLANDHRADNAALSATITVSSAPAHGSVVVSPSGHLIYTPNSTFSGTETFVYSVTNTFTYNLGGTVTVTSSASALVTITVNPTNHAPVVYDFTRATTEDTALTLAKTDFAGAFTDSDGNGLGSVHIMGLPANGTLKYNGTALNNSDIAGSGFTVSATDLQAGKLTFQPANDWPQSGNATTSFTWKAFDDNAFGALGSSLATTTIRVTAVNDAPILTATTTTLPAINEDTGGGAGVTVASLISVTDTDSASLGMAVTAFDTDLSHGKWQYTGADGWTDMAVSANMARLLSSSTLVRFVSAANWAGTSTLTFRAWDGSAGSAGGQLDALSVGGSTALSAASGTATITVDAVADKPVLTVSNTYTEPATPIGLTIAAALADTDETLSAVTITGVPTGATLSAGTLNGNGSWTVAVADLATLQFTPPAGVTAADYTLTTSATSTESNATTATSTASFHVAVGAQFVTVTASYDGSAIYQKQVITGSDANNVIIGGTAADTIDGGAGNDTLTAGDGNDIVHGGTGDDLIVGGSGKGNDSYYGDAGIDTLKYSSAFNTVTVDLTAGTASGIDIGTDTIDGIENVIGGAGDDTLTGNAGANVLSGGGGNDTVNYANAVTAVTVNLTTGIASGANIGTDTLDSMENATGGAGDDIMTGSAVANVLNGGSGNDTLTAGDGNDTVHGNDGDDLIISGTGNDSYYGDAGIDTISYSSAVNAVTVDLTAGTASGIDIGTDTVDGIENVIGGGGNDSMTGNTGDNVLSGGSGDDILTGLGGNDILTGGAGVDTFRIGQAESGSTVTDFVRGTDKLDLANTDGYGLLQGVFPYAGSVAATVTAIEANSALNNTLVFFTTATDGWIYVKGQGELVKLEGVTQAPLASDFVQSVTPYITTNEDTASGGIITSVFAADSSRTYDFGLDCDSTPITTWDTDYGSVTINATTGVYTYTPGEGAQILAEGATAVDSFLVFARDTASGTANSKTVTVNLTGVDDPTIIEHLGTSAVSYKIGHAPVGVVRDSVIVTDVDAAYFTQVTVSITDGTPDDFLDFDATGISSIGYDGDLYFEVDGVWDAGGSISGGYGGDPLVITFTREASAEVVQDVLRSVQFQSDDTTPGTRTLSFVVTNNDAMDSTAVTRTVTISPDMIEVLGANQAGGSLRFDGVDDYAHAAADTLAVGTGDFTIEATVNALRDTGMILSKHQDGAANTCSLSLDGGYLRFTMDDGTSSVNFTSAPQTIELNEWTHVAVVRTGRHFELYVNGQFSSQANSAGLIDMESVENASDLLVVGGQLGSDGLPVQAQAFEGQIDNVRLWDAARTDTEIQENWQLATPTDSNGTLVADWTMNAQAAGAVPNAINGPALVLGADANDSDLDPARINPPGHALEFNGGFIQMQHAIVTRTMTVEAWVKPYPGEVSFFPIFTANNAGNSGALSIGLTSSGLLSVTYVDAQGATTGPITSIVPVQFDSWNHVAVVFDTNAAETSGNVTLYVDGVDVGGATGVGVQVQSLRESAYVGHSTSGDSFHGQMADLRIWDEARTPADISSNMNVRLSGDEFGLMANMALGDSHGDYNNNNNTLTIAPNDSHGEEAAYGDGVITGCVTTVTTKPAAFGDTLTTRENTAIISKLLVVDESGHDELSYSVATEDLPEHGWLYIQQDGTFNYRPKDGFVGTDTFTVKVLDTVDPTRFEYKTISVQVNAVDHPVSAEDPPASASHDAVGLYGSTAIELAGGLATGGVSVTYEAWARQDSFSAAPQYILSTGGVGGDTFSLSMVNGVLHAKIGQHEFNTIAPVDPLAWHHLAARLDTDGASTTVTLFVDGDIYAEDTFTGTYNIAGTNAYLGRSLNTVRMVEAETVTDYQDYWHGKLSDIRVYTEARSQADIRADMAGSADTTNLVARWTGAKGATEILVDSSANNHDGSFIGGPNHGWGDRVMAVTNIGQSVDLSGLQLADPELTWPANQPISLSLHVKYGTLHLANLGNTLVSGANDSALLVLSGTIADLTSALSAMTYIPANGFTGRDKLDVLIDEMNVTLTRKDGGSLDILVLSPAPTEGADTLMGTANADIIDGLGGNDIIIGAAGNDILIGGGGADTLSGGTGNDVLSASAPAASTKLGAEFQINTNFGGDQVAPSVAALTDGGYVVVWEDNSATLGDTDVNAIHAQRYYADGTARGGEFLINTITERYQSQPKVTGLTDGGFAVVWRDDLLGTGGDVSGASVYAQIFNADGSKRLGTDFLVNTAPGTGNQHVPNILALPGGGFVASWADDSTGTNNVMAQAFNSAGAKVGSQFMVNSELGGHQGPASMIRLTDGSIVMVWDDSSGAFGDTDQAVHGQRFNADLTKLGGEFLVNTATGASQYQSTITALEGGGFVVAWRDDSGSGGDPYGIAVRAQRFAADGSKSGGEFLVNTTIVESQHQPAIIALKGGGFLVAWSDNNESGLNNVQAQQFDAAGAKVGGEFTVNSTTTGNQALAALAQLADGRIVATWIDTSQAGGDTSGWAIRGQILAGVSNVQLDGGSGNDILTGGAGNDTLKGGDGSDNLTGGAGNDIAVFTGNASQYTITTDGSHVLVTDTVAGRDGTDDLTGVETLHFQDRTFDHLVLGSAGADQFSANMAPPASALSLDGSDDAVTVSMAPTAVNSFTFETWIKLDTAPYLASLLSSTNWNTGALHLIIQNDAFLLGAHPNGVQFNYSVSANLVGAPHHVAIAYDDVAHSAMLYVDGQLVDTKSFDTPDPIDFSQFTIGAWNNGSYVERFVDGAMADVRLWTTARTQDDILGSMNESLTGTESGLLGNWQLDGNTNDNSTGAHNGTFSGGTPNYTALTQPAVSLDDALIVGGAGSDSLTITYSASLTDTDFTNLHSIETLVLGSTASAAQKVQLGATSQKAGLTTVDASASIAAVTLDASDRTAAITLTGGGGNDTLTGGSGADSLTGGSGSDSFVFHSNADSRGVIGGVYTEANVDRVTDFTSGSDKLVFEGMTGIGFATYPGLTGTSAAEVQSAIAAIQASPGSYPTDTAYFMTYGGQGYLYVNGAGVGANYDGTVIKLANTNSLLATDIVLGKVETATALHLDGSDGRVLIQATQSATLNMNHDFTIESWIKTTDANGVIFVKSAGGLGMDQWGTGGKFFGVSNGYLRVDECNIGALFSDTRVDDGQWHHVAMTFTDSTNDVRFYLDGASNGGGTLAFTPDNSTHLIKLGAELFGDLADVQFWDVARSQSDIAATRFDTLNGNEANLAADWDFGSHSASDLTSNHLGGALEGNALPQYVASTAPVNFTATGGAGNDILTGAAGNDILHAASGGDVVYGNAGNDRIGITDTSFHTLSGGTGIDTLVWEGNAATTIDLTKASGTIQGFEAVDLSATGAQTLVLDAQHLLSMTDGTNALTGTNDTLVIMGAGDSVQLNGGTWTVGATNATITPNDGHSYSVYSDSSTNAQVYVDNTVSVTHT